MLSCIQYKHSYLTKYRIVAIIRICYGSSRQLVFVFAVFIFIFFAAAVAAAVVVVCIYLYKTNIDTGISKNIRHKIGNAYVPSDVKYHQTSSRIYCHEQ